jgi:hypothetical protein
MPSNAVRWPIRTRYARGNRLLRVQPRGGDGREIRSWITILSSRQHDLAHLASVSVLSSQPKNIEDGYGYHRTIDRPLEHLVLNGTKQPIAKAYRIRCIFCCIHNITERNTKGCADAGGQCEGNVVRSIPFLRVHFSAFETERQNDALSNCHQHRAPTGFLPTMIICEHQDDFMSEYRTDHANALKSIPISDCDFFVRTLKRIATVGLPLRRNLLFDPEVLLGFRYGRRQPQHVSDHH